MEAPVSTGYSTDIEPLLVDVVVTLEEVLGQELKKSTTRFNGDTVNVVPLIVVLVGEKAILVKAVLVVVVIVSLCATLATALFVVEVQVPTAHNQYCPGVFLVIVVGNACPFIDL